MDNYHVVGDPNLAPPVPATDVDASRVAYGSSTVESALDDAFLKRGTATQSDMNDITEMGIWTINPSVTTQNVPVSSKWGMVEVYKNGSSVIQRFKTTDNSENYERMKTGSPLVWSVWKAHTPIRCNNNMQLHNLVANNPSVVDITSFKNFIFTNYFYPNGELYQRYTFWSVNVSSDSRYTACAKSFADQYKKLTNISPSYGEIICERIGFLVVRITFRPLSQDYPSMSCEYWNASVSWSSGLNQNSGWAVKGNKWYTLYTIPSGITVPTTGYDITLDWNLVKDKGEYRVRYYGFNNYSQVEYSASGNNRSLLLSMVSGFDTTPKTTGWRFVWSDVSSSLTACKLYKYENGSAVSASTSTTYNFQFRK